MAAVSLPVSARPSEALRVPPSPTGPAYAGPVGSVVLHLAAACGLLSWSRPPPPPPPPAIVLVVDFAAPMAEAVVTPPPPPAAPVNPVARPEPVEADPPAVLHDVEPPAAAPAPTPRRSKPKAPPPPNPPPNPPRTAPPATAAPATAAPPRAAAPPRTEAVPSDALATWQGALLDRLDRYKRYPRAARLRRQHGVAQLRLVIDRQGQVLAASLAASSGIALLDDEVLALARRAAPLPPPPETVAGATIELVLPVAFHLR